MEQQVLEQWGQFIWGAMWFFGQEWYKVIEQHLASQMHVRILHKIPDSLHYFHLWQKSLNWTVLFMVMVNNNNKTMLTSLLIGGRFGTPAQTLSGTVTTQKTYILTWEHTLCCFNGTVITLGTCIPKKRPFTVGVQWTDHGHQRVIYGLRELNPGFHIFGWRKKIQVGPAECECG